MAYGCKCVCFKCEAFDARKILINFFFCSLSFIQIDQLLMDMMDDLIQYDLYLICETDPFLIEPSSSSSYTGDSGMERIVDPNGGGCPVCLFPIGNQLLDDTAWKFHSVCFNFYNHLEKIA